MSTGSKRTRKGRRTVVLTGVTFVVLAGAALFLSWDHLRFWRLFESLGPNEQGYAEYRHRQTGIVMVRVPGGGFMTGSIDAEARTADASGVESSRYEVTLGPFLIAKDEVSQETWVAVMGASGRYRVGEVDSELPAAASWYDCQEFCKRTGLHLPTAAEWEYACRGGTETPSSSRESEMANNPYGIVNMLDGDSEWCEDIYDPGFWQRPESRKPNPVCTTPISGDDFPRPRRVLQGGDPEGGRSGWPGDLGLSVPGERGVHFRVVFRLWEP